MVFEMKCDICGGKLEKAYCTSNVCETCCKIGKCPLEETCAYKYPEFIGKTMGTRMGIIKRRKKEESKMGIEIYDGDSKTNTHWIQRNSKPTIYVDLHHTLSDHCGACPEEFDPSLCAGNPQEGAREAMTELSKMFHITIFTGHGNTEEVSDWLRTHKIPFDDIKVKPSQPCFIIDDRGVRHEDWDSTLAKIKKRLSMTERRDEIPVLGVEPSD